MVTIGISRIHEHLLPNEEILWKGNPASIIPSKVGNLIPITLGAIITSYGIANIIPAILSQQPINFEFIFITLVGLIFLGVGSLIFSTKVIDSQYYITNQRVLIYSRTYVKKPIIINLNEVNGEIEIKYNKLLGTGSINIPSPHWNRFVTPQYISPDIRNIKDPQRVYDILIEALETGKRNKWKQDPDSIFK